MIQNKFGEMIFNESDICDLVMQGRDMCSMKNVLVDNSVNLEKAADFLETFPDFVPHTFTDNTVSVKDWDSVNQQTWHMPKEYKELDIAAYVLGLCTNEAELQRCGEELLLYQERDLFNLLRYLKYLVDVMIENKIIWGVGRGSSVASYVLYKLGVHRIDSLFYNLNVQEFLR
jgi:hypothetical protein